MTKDNKIEIFLGFLGFAGTIIGAILGNAYGTEKQNEYIQSQIANVVGDGNKITFNNIDDLIKKYNELEKENKKLIKQNTDYYDENETLKAKVNTYKDKPDVELQDLGLCIDGNDMNINNQQSYAKINGKEYFSNDFIECLKGDDKAKIIKNNILYIGRIMENKSNLFLQHEFECIDIKQHDVISDPRGNEYVNTIEFPGKNSRITYSLNRKYSLLKFKITLSKYTGSDSKGIISVFADDNLVYTSESMTKKYTEVI